MRLRVLILLIASLSFINGEVTESSLCEDSDEYLDMTDRGLQRIEKEFLQNSSYSCINLSGNGITEVEEGALESMTKLQYLNLTGNKLSLQFLSTYGHPTVKVLVLDEAFADIHLPKHRNKGIFLPILLKFPRLKHLYLRRNKFERIMIPSWSCSFPQITHLYLDDNRLQSTSFLTTLPATLTHLYLRNNSLTVFTSGSLDNLKVLNVDHNNLQVIGKNECRRQRIYLKSAINLEKLSLFNNLLYQVEEGAMENLTNLKYLDLSDNFLWNIPPRAFQNLSSLLDLKLNKNNLTSVPNLCNLHKLKSLHLGDNAIEYIKRETFCNLRHLRYVDLSYNAITRIESSAFDMMRSLTTLDLSWNYIETFSRVGLTRTNYRLEDSINVYLDMANCSLQRLTEYFLHHSFYICIDLSGNNIQEVEESTIGSMTKIIMVKSGWK
ncbi:leucine-rich repeat-containing G-protein coupled receptor 5A-like [Diachasma alloeum]|uniref:leucine-rich repeat-containing G-protein coupled receptor 5A-like n=1 Tax=Diachasma alloeum TaxID=454923 RepID=UPI0010FB81B0|nr:leucine-rich repeat-containing G-protein coupled receptor 5A-like [Diachasma alloeum]